MRLLVVEDEGLVLMTLVDMLEDLGHEVRHEASNITSALMFLERGASEIDACILDANLGGEPAAPVAEKLREAGVPFIIASGYESQELCRSGLTERSLAKPYSVGQLAAALERL